MSKLFTTILPSLLIGGLLFGTTLTGAQPAPPTPPTAPVPPKPPKPPKAPKVKGQIHIDLGDLDDMVDEQIQNALESIGDDEHLPPHVREALRQRLEKVRAKMKKRFAKINPTDLDGLKVELGQMGDELGREMEDFGKEMEKWSKDFEKNIEKKVEAQVKQHKKLVLKGKDIDMWKGPVIADLDDEDMPGAIDIDDDEDVTDKMHDMDSITLDDNTKRELKALRDESQRKVDDAKRELEQASTRLQSLIEKDGASEKDISDAIDRVTRAEGAIRKARIMSWVKARGKLDASTRRKIEKAARK